ncbi:unnamed protein product [Chondrus crispus]|uniref:Uncharacterized protein n=1 Tax=Chondrus crispus TaxID=2769 RepID=R7QC99_CHOCR|nr:unnamed protein product [Chondrus crispus]CDF35085.1 unnamed protein product [Chondrus crispus]|eukprot:XP_005714904.1 unnamed protein product [Chondrus crispus]
MGRGRKKDHRAALVRRQKVLSQVAFCNSVCRRSTFADSAFCHNTATLALAMKIAHAIKDYRHYCTCLRRVYVRFRLWAGPPRHHSLPLSGG